MRNVTKRSFGQILRGSLAGLGLALAGCSGSLAEQSKPTFDENILRVYAPFDFTSDGLEDILGVTEDGRLGLFTNDTNNFVLSEILDYDGQGVTAVALSNNGKVIAGLDKGELRVYSRNAGNWSLDQKILHKGVGDGPGFVTGIKTLDLNGEQYIFVGVQAPIKANFSGESLSAQGNSFSFAGRDNFSGRGDIPQGSFSDDDSYSFGNYNDSFATDFATGGERPLRPYNRIFKLAGDSLEEVTFERPWKSLLEAGNAQTYAVEPFSCGGKQMLFIANDFADDHLFEYEDGEFRKVPLPLNETGPTFSMGATACSNSDGTSSIYVTDLHRIVEYVVDSNGVRLFREMKFKDEPDPSPGSITAWPVKKIDDNLIVGFGGIWPGHIYNNREEEISTPRIMVFDKDSKRYHPTDSDVHQMEILRVGSKTYALTQRFPSMVDDGSLVGIYEL
ncbi:hypothetical protein J4459_00665 [Candidatus Woesearchaeota archaeon]|nr:hypothetical protein [Candidatus Woesearchaeota archaeon]